MGLGFPNEVKKGSSQSLCQGNQFIIKHAPQPVFDLGNRSPIKPHACRPCAPREFKLSYWRTTSLSRRGDLWAGNVRRWAFHKKMHDVLFWNTATGNL